MHSHSWKYKLPKIWYWIWKKTMIFVYKWLQPGNLVILMLVSKCQLQPLFFKIYVAVSYVTRLWSLKYSSLSSFFVAIAFLKEAFDGLSLVVFVFSPIVRCLFTLPPQLFSLALKLKNFLPRNKKGSFIKNEGFLKS